MPDLPPPHSTIGLLEGIAANSLDDDYYEVRPLPPGASGSGRTIVTATGLALFALLVTIASLQTRTDRPANLIERNTLVSNIQDRKKSIDTHDAEARKLAADVARLRALSNRTDPSLQILRVVAADLAATGPGIIVTVDDSTSASSAGRVTDADLQRLVNGLWYAGAEAIAINGSRLSTLTPIRKAGQAITVNFASLTSPYTLSVIGNASSLGDKLAANPDGRYWAQRVKQAGLRFDVQGASRISVPAAPANRLTILHATAVKGAS